MGKHISSGKKKSIKIRFDLNSTVSPVSEEEESQVSALEIIKIATAFAILLLVCFFRLEGIVRLIAFLIPFFVISFDVIISVMQAIQKGNIADDSLVILAASVLAFLIGKYTEAVAAMILYRLMLLGMKLLAQRQRKQRDDLKTDLRSGALLATSIGTIRSDLNKLQPEDILILRNGERLPADGVLLEGDCSMDVSFLMGENTVRSFHAGEFIPAGSISCSADNIKIRLLSTVSESFWDGLQDRIDHSDIRASVYEKKLKNVFHILNLLRFPAALLLIVLGGAVTGEWSVWFVRAIIVLLCSGTFLLKKIITVLFQEAVYLGAGQGIFIKNNETLEKLENARTFVFEKNGVITDGEFEIRDLKAVGIPEKELFAYIAKTQIRSESLVSYAFRTFFDDEALAGYRLDQFQEIPGQGVSAVINRHRVNVGNYSYVSRFCSFEAQPAVSGTTVHLALDGRYAGYITLSDHIKDGVFDAFEKLRANSIERIVLLTEDSATASRKIASSLNFDLIRAEITPEEKCNSLAYLIKNKQKGSFVAFAGSYLSYSELYTTADVGLMLHPLHMHPMKKEADVLLFHPSVSKIADCVSICVAAMRKIRIVSAAGLTAAGLLILLGIFGATGLLATLILLALTALAEILFVVYQR
jgi:Cd2+/Zn2+-exporting ATPase